VQRPTPATAITHVEASFVGPLPPPGMLVKYNEAFPGAAERLVAMAERQSTHREALETTVLSASVTSQKRGSYFGFIISMTAILGGIYLIALGKSVQGLVAIISSLTALTVVFVLGRKKQDKELKEKSEALAKRTNRS
jgi:uncharacterized membrane protein